MILILYYFISRLVTLLKIIDAPKQVSDTFYLTVNFEFINFSLQIYLLFVPEMSTSFSRLTLFILSTLLCFGSCYHRNLACFLWSTSRKHSSSNHGLCCFKPHRLPLAEVLKFSLMFSQTLLMSSLSFKFSKATNLFRILIWDFFLTSRALSFLRLNHSILNFCAACLLAANLSLTSTTTR